MLKFVALFQAVIEQTKQDKATIRGLAQLLPLLCIKKYQLIGILYFFPRLNFIGR